jgi:hypothetical protein
MYKQTKLHIYINKVGTSEAQKKDQLGGYSKVYQPSTSS